MAPELPRRKNPRLFGFDYSEPGMYFVTPCVHQHQNRFGNVIDGAMHPNPAGRMVMDTWHQIPRIFPQVVLDAWVLMPNHFHGILMLDPEPVGRKSTLGEVMKWFKSVTTKRYGNGVRNDGWPPFDGHLWQRNYYDHVVRNDADLDRVRTYIEHNPAAWNSDALFREVGGDASGDHHG